MGAVTHLVTRIWVEHITVTDAIGAHAATHLNDYRALLTA